SDPITMLDGQRVVVSYRDDLEEWGWDTTRSNIPVALSSTSSNRASTTPSTAPGCSTAESKSRNETATPTSTKSAAYHPVGLVRAATSPQQNTSELDLSPGDDTQSDVFFNEL